MCAFQGDDLASLFGAEAQAITAKTAKRIAEDTGEFIVNRTKALTPVKTGKTRDSFELIDAHLTAPHTYESGVRSFNINAVFLEYGVDPHTIEADDSALRTPVGPRDEVHHPGTKGSHAVSRAVSEAEVSINVIARPALDEWVTAIERLPNR